MNIYDLLECGLEGILQLDQKQWLSPEGKSNSLIFTQYMKLDISSGLQYVWIQRK